MTAKNIQAIDNPADFDARSNYKPLTDDERERIRKYYCSLNFKEFLAACPIDGIDLTREPEYPRETEL